MFCRSFFIGGYGILAIPTQSNCMQTSYMASLPYPRNLIVCKTSWMARMPYIYKLHYLYLRQRGYGKMPYPPICLYPLSLIVSFSSISFVIASRS